MRVSRYIKGLAIRYGKDEYDPEVIKLAETLIFSDMPMIEVVNTAEKFAEENWRPTPDKVPVEESA